MRVGEQRAAEFSLPVRPEPELHAGEAQRPLRVTLTGEDRRADSVRPLDDEPGVDRVSALFGLTQPSTQALLAVRRAPLLIKLRVSLEIGVHIVRRQEGEDREPC